ncbi:hypothetical protein D3C87_1012550 [compost metagenome]
MCDDNSKKSSLSRRNFLGSAVTLGAGAFLLDPVRALTEGIADGVIQRAYAESTGAVASRNYVNIQMSGAPLRYQFDQWLRTNTTDLAIENGIVRKPDGSIERKLNPMTCTAFTWLANGTVTPKMATTVFNNVLVPHLWSQTVFNSAGAKRPLTELLQNMLVVRGFGTGLDGHPFNLLAQQAPIGGVSTITGIVAENTKTTFDSVQWPDRGDRGTYFSSQGKSQSKASGSAPLNSLMEGFGTPATTVARNLKTTYKDAMELAQARLKTYARSDNTGSKLVSLNMNNATDMMAKGVGNIASYWPAAVARYQAAIEKSMREINIPGISEKAIISDESGSWTMGTGDLTVISKEYDVRLALASVSMQNFAQSLALAEYLLKEGLAASIDLRADALQSLMILQKGFTSQASKTLGLDMHGTGSNAAILFMNAYYRGLTAGILELKDQLGAARWENTVVQIQGDFGRSARADGTGSDHGYNQMVTSAFSGAFTNGPIVVGNIKQSGSEEKYSGTQGLAAGIPGYNQKGMPSPSMAASTITALLGAPHNPYANTAEPLVSLLNGRLSALYPAKIVA